MKIHAFGAASPEMARELWFKSPEASKMTPKLNRGPLQGRHETQISMKMSSFHMFLTVPAEGGPREGGKGEG